VAADELDLLGTISRAVPDRGNALSVMSE